MMRVGLVVGHTDYSWVGGLNYLRTLVAAVQSLPDRTIQLVLLFSEATPSHIRQAFPGTEQVSSSWLTGGRINRLLRRSARLLFGIDMPLESLLRRNDIPVLSHSWHFDHASNTRTIEWIPDLQHRHLPAFFSDVERRTRDRHYRRAIRSSAALVVSSHAALNDLREFDPAAAEKSHVLQFVAHPDVHATRTVRHELELKYQIRGEYFHLPNQFWAHKNHRIVVEALGLLKTSGLNPLVLCTGLTVDHKRPEFFESLMSFARAMRVEDQFRPLGVVPREDLYGLMEHSVSVINPSFFEGWSSTVEEAKALGKRIILSKLPVHIEQAPRRGTYFDPSDAPALASHMRAAIEQAQREEESTEAEIALAQYRKRFLELGRCYQRLVESVG
jgi:glycosyltransferase involved in cell wall biosynthesis